MNALFLFGSFCAGHTLVESGMVLSSGLIRTIHSEKIKHRCHLQDQQEKDEVKKYY